MVLLILVAGGVYAVADAVLSDTPVPEEPVFMDTVLASRAVVAAIRIAIIAAAVFVVLSVAQLVRRGRYLTRIGPIEASEDVSNLVWENTQLRAALEDAGSELANLEEELADTNDLLLLLAGTDTIEVESEEDE